MNKPTTEPVTNPAEKCCHEVDERIRRNPGTAMLIAVGAGLAIGLLVRALRPAPTPQHRVARMLEDIQRRVRDVAGPALHRAGALASEGAEAVSDGLHTGGARLGRFVRDGGKKLRHLFH
ncbi:MAG: hypothetical protein ABI318_23740 [Chthoniobacteraceae bacterium]